MASQDVAAEKAAPGSSDGPRRGPKGPRKRPPQAAKAAPASKEIGNALLTGAERPLESAPKAVSTAKGPSKQKAAAETAAAIADPPASSSSQRPGQTPALKKTETPKKKKGSKSTKSKNKTKGDADGVNKPKLKVVVRRLPPNLPEDIFWKAVGPWVALPQAAHDDIKQPEESHSLSPSGATTEIGLEPNVDSYYYVAGKLKDRTRRGVAEANGAAHHTFSRAYMRFKNAASLVRFHQAFDGHLFRDAKGNEYWAVVEFAPYDVMPTDASRRKKKDTLVGTIESDAHYKAFLASLDKKSAKSDGDGRSEAQLLAHLNPGFDKAAHLEQARHTPLLDHLRAQRAAKLGAAHKPRSQKSVDTSKASVPSKGRPGKRSDSSKAKPSMGSKADIGKENKKGAKGVQSATVSDAIKGRQAKSREGDARRKTKNADNKTGAPHAPVAILAKEPKGHATPQSARTTSDNTGKPSPATSGSKARDKKPFHPRDETSRKSNG